MCGIAGLIDFSCKSTKEELLDMAASLVHRGPDDSGSEWFEREGFVAGLGFRRLAIIDLSPGGHQPMIDPQSGNWIVFNGEIYNYSEIRQDLEAQGIRFSTASDTEVILKAYATWGTAAVDRFIGMFAFCILDLKNSKVILIRDRAGVKPWYYYFHNDLFLFSSELKAFHRHKNFDKKIDPDAAALFFQHGYIPAPHSIFRNTRKLLPGSVLELDLKTKSVSHKKYWDVLSLFKTPVLKLGFEEAMDETDKLMKSAFAYRMVADVPVGVFLSGGYDSSCVTSVLQSVSSKPLKTFTIGFEDPDFNEAGHARAIADYLGTDHHEYICTLNEAMSIVPDLPVIYDEPFGDPSAVPTTLVSRIARKDVTVALSADGGDELFAGYPRHWKSLRMINRSMKIPALLAHLVSDFLPANKIVGIRPDRTDKLKSFLRAGSVSQKFTIINRMYSELESKHLLSVPINNINTPFDEASQLKGMTGYLNQVLATEYTTYLPDDILHKVDRATMSAGLEGRDPFLDHRLVTWMARIPEEYKMKGRDQKILLKAIVHKYIPESLMNRPKMGFGIPLHQWMRKELSDMFKLEVSDANIRAAEILNVDAVRSIRDDYIQNGAEIFERVWLLFVFCAWYRKWMSN
ncbi:MAG: asparagine synthase (glutamine-hydrolyzing) [Bacteroidia bacterium]|nr:asparagine synthase (glutamine-hydrolyzing) [Bacteroidia bacterium]